MEHSRCSKRKHPKLYYSIKKYGYEYFKSEVIEICDELSLSEREIYYIEKYDSFNNGLNSTTGGEKNYERSEETKEKIRNTNLGKYYGSQNNPFYIDDVLYESIGKAHKSTSIPAKTIHNRLNSNNPKFSNYIYVKQKQEHSFFQEDYTHQE